MYAVVQVAVYEAQVNPMLLLGPIFNTLTVAGLLDSWIPGLLDSWVAVLYLSKLDIRETIDVVVCKFLEGFCNQNDGNYRSHTAAALFAEQLGHSPILSKNWNKRFRLHRQQQVRENSWFQILLNKKTVSIHWWYGARCLQVLASFGSKSTRKFGHQIDVGTPSALSTGLARHASHLIPSNAEGLLVGGRCEPC